MSRKLKKPSKRVNKTKNVKKLLENSVKALSKLSSDLKKYDARNPKNKQDSINLVNNLQKDIKSDIQKIQKT